MELKKAGERLAAVLRDRKMTRLVFILGIAGILLIYLSSWIKPREAAPEPEPAPSQAGPSEFRQRLEEDLCRVVRAVTGEDSPEVMITLEDDGSYIYAADSKTSQRQDGLEEESSHVILEDGGGGEQGLKLSQLQPQVKGVVIVSRGARDPAVREKLVNAARTALGVSSARVCVVDGDP